MSELDGKVIWLTGASSGIGKALVSELVSAGAQVAITSRRKEALDAVAAELEAQRDDVHVFPGDVTDLDAMRRTVVAIENQLGAIDIAIANAGSYRPSKVLHFDSEEYLDLMNLNFGGMLHVVEAVLPGMIERRNGYLVGVASVVGYRGFPEAAAYGASKAAMINFLESLRFGVRQKNIRVSIVNPGFVKTPLTDKNEFTMPCLITAEEAAARIRKGLERGAREIHFPGRFSWVLKTLRIIPFALYDFLVSRLIVKEPAR